MALPKANFFGDREGGHVTKFGIAIRFGARTGKHASQILHIFHGAQQVAKVLVIGFDNH